MKKILFFLFFTICGLLDAVVLNASIFYIPHQLIKFFYDFLGNTFTISGLVSNQMVDPLDVVSFDIILANHSNFYVLIFAATLCFLFILFLLLQANLLNLSFYPNATFDAEKYSPYECGFTPFWTERAQFDIKFYLVALLFLVFDVELMFLLPYSLSYHYLGFFGYIIFLLFFSILVIGFLVEWSTGMLVWKGEEDLSINSVYFAIKQWKIKNKIRIYYWFVRDYLRLFDYWAITRKLWRYSFVDKNHLIRKIKIWKPMQYWYYREQPKDYFPRDKFDFFDYDDTGYFINVWFWIPCYGARTVSLYTTLYQKEKEEKEARIVRYLTIIFGEPFVEYYNKLPKHEWNFTLM